MVSRGLQDWGSTLTHPGPRSALVKAPQRLVASVPALFWCGYGMNKGGMERLRGRPLPCSSLPGKATPLKASSVGQLSAARGAGSLLPSIPILPSPANSLKASVEATGGPPRPQGGIRKESAKNAYLPPTKNHCPVTENSPPLEESRGCPQTGGRRASREHGLQQGALPTRTRPLTPRSSLTERGQRRHHPPTGGCELLTGKYPVQRQAHMHTQHFHVLFPAKRTRELNSETILLHSDLALMASPQ